MLSKYIALNKEECKDEGVDGGQPASRDKRRIRFVNKSTCLQREKGVTLLTIPNIHHKRRWQMWAWSRESWRVGQPLA